MALNRHTSGCIHDINSLIRYPRKATPMIFGRFQSSKSAFNSPIFKQYKERSNLKMPDSPVPVSAEMPIVASPRSLHISTSTTQRIDGRSPLGIPNGIHTSSPNGPLSPGMLNGMQLPPICGARQLSKLKRFLTTLQQFGSDISPDIGERVRVLIVNLINNGVTVEEFHQQLQDATNFPLRPFVIPFLKENLPLLQQELLNCAHLSKRSPHQYMTPVADMDREQERIKTEVEDFGFERPIGEKRKNEIELRLKENGHHSDSLGSSPVKKKYHGVGFDSEGSVFVDQLMENIKNDSDEWRNVETMLQYIVSFVEKAKRSITILQERCLRDREEMASWARAMAADAENEIKRRTAIDQSSRNTEERVNELKRCAEEAVNDVKRQAVVELQKAVTAAEEKANDALNQAHQRREKAIMDARRQAAEDALLIANLQENSKENCWNCGRKANETCSGCSVARYCGSFCQHKDWEHHHKECGKHAKDTILKPKSPRSLADKIESGKPTQEKKCSPRPVAPSINPESLSTSKCDSTTLISAPQQ
ncbi:protein CBFA2T3 isoform X2 [Hydra vulgaris]|uniref:Protein CBFA2T3 isoform X2 n=2 Tax=Hydra vulgaris TaxID=6087 RepID=A0ABM4DNK1_HYDVU